VPLYYSWVANVNAMVILTRKARRTVVAPPEGRHWGLPLHRNRMVPPTHRLISCSVGERKIMNHFVVSERACEFDSFHDWQ